MMLLTNMPDTLQVILVPSQKEAVVLKRKKKKETAQDTSYRIKQIIQHKKTPMASKKNMKMRELLQKSD